MYKTYKHLLDVKLDNSTFLILLVAILILLVGTYVPNHRELVSKNNVLEISSINESYNVIVIDGKKYLFKLEEIK